MQDSYLRLTGPTRGVLINDGFSHFEAVLKVKGITEADDKNLSKFAMCYNFGDPCSIEGTTKLCTVEMQRYTVISSVEATVSVRVFKGEWPHGFRGVLTASTAGEGTQISLLDLKDDTLPIDAGGFIKLSRRVVCVENDGMLGVSLFEHSVGEEVASIWLAAEKSGRATHRMYVKKFSFLLGVTVAWSVFVT
jgi:hypothetical protein